MKTYNYKTLSNINNSMNKNLIKWRLTLFVILILTIVFLQPFFSNLVGDIYFEYIRDNRDGFNSTVIRSLIFALSTTIFIIFFSFFGALSIKRVPIYSRKGVLLSILIIPFLLGSVSTAFLYKIIFLKGFSQDAIITGIPITHFILLIAIQFWQFGLLFLYLFWLNFKNIPKSIEDYAIVSKFSFFTRLKNIYIPQSRSLIILLSIFSFIFSFYENAKSQFIFKASQGTNTELISNWLYRTYQSKLLVSPDYAIGETFGISFYLILTIAIVLFFGVIVLNFLIKKIVKAQFYSNMSLFPRKIFEPFITVLNQLSFFVLLLLVLTPIIFVFFKIEFKTSENIAKLFTPFTLTFIAAIFATIISLLFALSSRIGWRNKLFEFNNYSIAFFVGIFLLFLIPSITILLSGFKWMSYFGYNSNLTVYLAWIIGHSILLLPLLASFLLTTHFRVSNNELSYISTIAIKPKELVKFSFLKRFKLEYILTFIIAYSFIWNESTINKVFSDRIASFASDLEMQFIGRGSDYSVALMYFSVSIFLAILGILIWSAIINKKIQIR